MTPQQFREAGHSLFGAEWFAPMGHALGIATNTVKKIEAGKHRPAPGIAADVAGLLRAESDRLQALAAEVVTAAGMVDDK